MSEAILSGAVDRIAEHARQHQLPFITVIFHGGEPLLAGHRLIGEAARALRAAVPSTTRLRLHIQTNGVRLSSAFLDLFAQYDIRVGVSLDGDRRAHDRHRVFAGGAGSFQATAQALRLLNTEAYRHLYSGILCTVDLANDPLAVYHGLLEFQPPRVDFLLPHGNWTTPPPGRPAGSAETPYADWIIPVFDEWLESSPQRTGVRLFESLIDLVLGGPTSSEVLGSGPVDVLVIETDGALEQGDALKTTAPGMAATGLRVESSSFDEVLAQPGFRARQSGLASLCATCRSCRLVRVCGGGLYAHRYRAANGFDNPSVYCPDLVKLIDHTYARVAERLRALGFGPDRSPARASRSELR